MSKMRQILSHGVLAVVLAIIALWLTWYSTGFLTILWEYIQERW
jgi:hypothetical protein